MTFGVVFFLLWWLARTYATPFLAYGFAVLLDIPTHSTDFFATPFLWPLSSYKFNGMSWGEPFIFFPNLILLISAYLAWYFWCRRENIQAKRKRS